MTQAPVELPLPLHRTSEESDRRVLAPSTMVNIEAVVRGEKISDYAVCE
jgi:hypothetical protein